MKKILLIEDDEKIIEALGYALKLEGYEIHSAQDGESGLEMARSIRPDLILLDLLLPKMHGFEVCHALKSDKEFESIQVIILTALGDTENIVKGLSAGAEDFISKPYHLEELLARVKSRVRMKELYDKAREEEKKSEDKYKTLVKTLPDIVFKIDLDGNFTFISDFVRNLGYEPKELIGKNFREIIHPEDVKSVSGALVLKKITGKKTGNEMAPKIFDERRTGNRMTRDLEIRLLAKNQDGKTTDSKVVASIFAQGEVVSMGYYDSSQKEKKKRLIGTVGIIRDRTHRKQKEKDLHASEAKYRTLLENLPQKVFLKDVNSVYASCNQNYARDLQIKPEEIKGKTDYDFFPRELAEKYRTDDKRIITTGKPESLEEKYIQSGKEVFVQTVKTIVRNEEGDPTGILGVFWDITERKSDEEKIKKLSRAVEQSPVSIVVTDTKGNIEYVNPKFIQLTGYSRDEAIGKTPRILKSGETPLREYKKLWSTIANGGEWRGEFHNKKKNGELYWELAAISPIKNADGETTHFLGIKEDITEQKKAEEKLKRSKASLTEAQRIAQLGNWDWDISTDSLWWSDEIYRIFGLTRKEFGATYQAFLDVVHLEDRKHVMNSVRRALYKNEPYQLEHRIVRPDGTERVVYEMAEVSFNENQEPIRMLGTVQDITERKQMEKALLEKTLHLDNILHSSTDLAIAATDLDFRITYYNPVAEKIFGYKAAEVVGKTVMDIHTKENVEHSRFEKAIEIVRKEGEYTYFVEQKTEEKTRHIKSRISGIWDKKNVLVGFVLMSQDITKSKQAEEEKEKVQAQLLQSQKMDAIGRLAAGVAHEINNPINNIINFAQILEDEQEKEMVERIKKEGRRIAGIVRNLLSFARDSRQEKSITTAHEIVSDSLALIETQIINNGISLTIDVPTRLPNIFANPQQIQQVFLNIIYNAQFALNQKYMEKHQDKILEIRGESVIRNGCHFVKVTFYDQGTGIPSELLPKIREPFFSTKPEGHGTGLGLSISYGIIENHDGRIVIESVVGEFTKVEIELPTAEQKEAKS